ncbi:MAG TPA: PAS domain-containing protein [Nitrosopumilus sp.]|jgi:PAS domain S-box-containing protein|nr:histidine kinase [Nitrososphaerota archaeon]MDP6327778.1 PAS domain-containing protein [Nitrosopumilus sp.]HJM25193.1 PAS domain-containing protein [Nitrosopumilus sp.]HJO31979.1 PAS domain-containing protein [Nitrosopumilus sp.]|tara:strand:- start:14823 stop:15350 length:528 start_codon:yes stop_codon:yes gene_type:complete
MIQTEARKILKDAPVMWRRINSIGIILDCNSTYAANLGYAKSEILGKPIFEHVPKNAWEEMNDSLKTWFETGKVTDRKIIFKKQDGSTFQGLLQATSLYDENKNLIGSNTVIFDLSQMNEEKIKEFEKFFKESNLRLEEIKKNEYNQLDENSKSEYNGLKNMFDMLSLVNLHELN